MESRFAIYSLRLTFKSSLLGTLKFDELSALICEELLALTSEELSHSSMLNTVFVMSLPIDQMRMSTVI